MVTLDHSFLYLEKEVVMNNINDTIAAIASAPGNSGIGIIRISGENSIFVADKVYKSVSGNLKLNTAPSHTIHYGYIFDGDELIDEVLVSVFRAPKSFTAEDTVEINCHGGYFVTTKILDLVIKNGARAAEPGEFTKRAFLNGRIDLSKAEAVIDIINSKNNFALKNSLSQLNGSVLNGIKIIRDKIIHETAFIECALDDPEHYDLDENRDEFLNSVNSIIAELEKILKNSENGRILKDGINTLILGIPNAGKSSILNILSGREKAIVTDIAGTTRDIIEETVNLNGITLNLIDTAGVRNTDNIVEKIGVEKALSSIDNADLILYVIDSSVEPGESDVTIADSINNKNVIVLKNKSDLKNDIKAVDVFLEKLNFPIVSLSAKTGDGIDELSDLIKDKFLSNSISYDEDIYITNVRQTSEIRNALSSMILVKDGILSGMTEDFITIDLMNAYTYLGNVIGEEVSDDLVDRIFKEFCMGK